MSILIAVDTPKAQKRRLASDSNLTFLGVKNLFTRLKSTTNLKPPELFLTRNARDINFFYSEGSTTLMALVFK